ncbi:MAG: HAMP domain-containing protein [Thermoflexales bacterium]|nr:HAMP domain-containing protein [Thermoflexales bacterium]
MPRTISARLILAFLAVSILGVALAAAITYWLTEREFIQLFYDQSRTRYVNEAEQYYAVVGSWQGIEAGLRPFPNAREGIPQRDEREPQGGGPVRGGGRGGQSAFALADQAGRIILGAPPVVTGTQLTAAQLAAGSAVEYNGERVGTVIAASPPQLGPLENSFLDRTNRAFLYAALGSAALALLLGVVLARTLTQPLRALTVAIRRMAAGDLKQTVRVRTNDELGELAAAFNHMSADLDALTQSRRQMTADIAHDLRTPLTVIGGYVESMRDGVLKPTPERLTTVGREVQLLQRLVTDLGTLAQAEGGQMRLNRAPLAADALLSMLAKSYQPLGDARNVRVLVDAPADLPHFSADPDRLAQVFGNLVTNALRHTPPGGSVTLSARRAANGVALMVTDTGEGISPQDLPHVFDRFYRGDKARSADGAESGLGLAIAKSIVEAHGGTIKAESAPGQGTTMRIDLTA